MKYASIIALMATTLFSHTAAAHIGHQTIHNGLADSFVSGLFHPILGLDHLILLIGLGFIISAVKTSLFHQPNGVFIALITSLSMCLVGSAFYAFLSATALNSAALFAGMLTGSFGLLIGATKVGSMVFNTKPAIATTKSI